MTLRAAIIGCGRIAWEMADDPFLRGDVFTHAHAYDTAPQTNLAAVCDTDFDKANACAKRWGCLPFSSVEKMLADVHPQIVSVATPDALHAETITGLLSENSGIEGILCEKPIATNLADAQRIVELCRAHGVKLAVMHMRRYAPNLTALAEYVRAGTLGRVTGVTGWYTKGVAHNGVHWFDQLRMIAGEVSWVEASNWLNDPAPDPTLDVTMGLADGAVAVLRAVDHLDYTIFEADFMFERGRVRIVDAGYQIFVSQAGPSNRYSGYVELNDIDTNFGSRRDVMLHAVNDLADAIRLDRAPASTGEDGLSALRIAVAATMAAASGDRVYLSSL